LNAATLRDAGVWAGFALAMLVAPYVFTSSSAHTALSLMAIAIVFSLSYNMLLGQTGLLSFGHAVYYGLAAFAVIHAMNAIIGAKWPIPVPAAPLIGGLAGLASAIVLGWPSTRRGGIVFSMITLGIAELVGSSSLILRTFFGGEDGIETNRTQLLPVFGYKFGSQIEIYYVIAAWCLASVALMYMFTRTPLGRMCGAVRDNPERAEFVGYDATRVRYLVMCLSGFFAGVAGALATLNFELANSAMLGAAQSTNVLVATYIGGAGYFWGPIVGAAIVTLLQFWLSDFTDAWMLYFGLLFIVVVMFVPDGVAGWISRHIALARTGRLGVLAWSYALVAPAFVLIFAGGVLLIELAHHALLERQSAGTAMSVFHVRFSDDSPAPWAVALFLCASGVVGLRFIWPLVGEAWGRASGPPEKVTEL
jgi:branched-chain amino acid transport system permease protein